MRIDHFAQRLLDLGQRELDTHAAHDAFPVESVSQVDQLSRLDALVAPCRDELVVDVADLSNATAFVEELV